MAHAHIVAHQIAIIKQLPHQYCSVSVEQRGLTTAKPPIQTKVQTKVKLCSKFQPEETSTVLVIPTFNSAPNFSPNRLPCGARNSNFSPATSTSEAQPNTRSLTTEVFRQRRPRPPPPILVSGNQSGASSFNAVPPLPLH